MKWSPEFLLVEHSHCRVMGAIFLVNMLPKVKSTNIQSFPWTTYNCSSRDSLLLHGLFICLLTLPPLFCFFRNTASSLKLEDKNSLTCSNHGILKPKQEEKQNWDSFQLSCWHLQVQCCLTTVLKRCIATTVRCSIRTIIW